VTKNYHYPINCDHDSLLIIVDDPWINLTLVLYSGIGLNSLYYSSMYSVQEYTGSIYTL
jgi:hypothetical protein